MRLTSEQFTRFLRSMSTSDLRLVLPNVSATVLEAMRRGDAWVDGVRCDNFRVYYRRPDVIVALHAGRAVVEYAHDGVMIEVRDYDNPDVDLTRPDQVRVALAEDKSGARYSYVVTHGKRPGL